MDILIKNRLFFCYSPFKDVIADLSDLSVHKLLKVCVMIIVLLVSLFPAQIVKILSVIYRLVQSNTYSTKRSFIIISISF